MFDLAAAARSESLSCNRAWGRGSPRATGEGGQRPWSTAGAGRTRAAQGGPLRPLRGLQETRVATREESGVLGFPSEICMQVRKQQLELDMEQQTCSK